MSEKTEITVSRGDNFIAVSIEKAGCSNVNFEFRNGGLQYEVYKDMSDEEIKEDVRRMLNEMNVSNE